jgi:hypothetical protein
MAVRSRDRIKAWFLRGCKPLASQFADWIDSYWHKDDAIPASSISGLQDLIDAKAEKSTIEAEAKTREEADAVLQSQQSVDSGKLETHIQDTSNPHAVTAGQLGLGEMTAADVDTLFSN